MWEVLRILSKCFFSKKYRNVIIYKKSDDGVYELHLFGIASPRTYAKMMEEDDPSKVQEKT